MKRNKVQILLSFLLLAVLLLSACGNAERQTAQYRIYLITKSTSTEFWRSVFAGANAAKAEYNVELTIVGPESEEDFVTQNAYIAQAAAEHSSTSPSSSAVIFFIIILLKQQILPASLPAMLLSGPL